MESGSGSPPPTVVSSPNKRLKTLISSSTGIEDIGEAESGSETKGKQPMPTDGGDSSICCGICWSDGGKAIRGFVDSCDHYFCFVCIMEWAKIESRCPMCKRRFTAIRRPSKAGVFRTERVVPVPERNQYGVVAGDRPFDPFAHVECAVCHGTHEENLLLLCDLCDSASHTFCVGLGATVPDGDWFCHDCSVSRTEHDSIQPDNDDDVCGSRDLEGKLDGESSVLRDKQPTDEDNDAGETSSGRETEEASVSIRDLVHEQDWCMPSRWRKRRVQEVTRPGKRSATHTELDESTLGNRNVADNAAAENGARTLTGCRNVHTYIRSIRENWDGLRSGSLRFRSNESINSSSNAGQSSAAVLPEQNCLPTSNAQQLGVTNDSPGTASASQETRSDDIDKAWKMMLQAKSVQLACQRGTKSMQQVSKCPSVRVSTSKEADNRSLRLHSSKTHELGTKECRGATPGTHELYSRGKTEKQVPSICTQKAHSNMQKHVKVTTKDSAGPSCRLSVASSSAGSNVVHENRHNELSRKLVGSGSKSRVDKKNGASCLSTAVLPGSLQTSALTPTKAGVVNGNVASHKAVAVGDRGQDDEAKTEIQSLVKLNLKLLSGGKHLGVERFKEVARVSTHTILAACGLEHSRRAVRSIPSPVCKHTEEIAKCSNGIAILIPSCCRDCFLGFVKEVVELILSEKSA
ncbi:unnamed protein product [Linum tenue]|uniref:PHD and RING finger domain-containing protein 1 n=1 Tax=Linum tenue TaxID=586396 RepID=A0AAV0MCN8_9ROSI|nr:unnamed protein product [Linum tenue]